MLTPCWPSRVGRPPKKDSQVVVHEPADDDMQFIQGLLDDSTWNLDPFCGYAPEGLPFPMEVWPAVQRLNSSDVEQPIMRPGEHLFETFSKLNAEIHRGREFTTQFKSSFDMSDFICKVRNTMNGYENVQMVLRTAQEFLVVFKSLRRQLGTRTVSCYGRQPYTHKAIKALTADAPPSPVSSHLLRHWVLSRLHREALLPSFPQFSTRLPCSSSYPATCSSSSISSLFSR